MDFDDAKRTGFLVNFAFLTASETRAKDKEVPVHVYEHTLARPGSAMPLACVHSADVSHAHRGVPRVGDVFEQANQIWSVPNDPSGYTGFPEGATSLRPLLQLFQPVGLDGMWVGPRGG